MFETHYLKGLLQRFNMTECRPRSTLWEVKLDIYNSNDYNAETDVRTNGAIFEILIYLQ